MAEVQAGRAHGARGGRQSATVGTVLRGSPNVAKVGLVSAAVAEGRSGSAGVDETDRRAVRGEALEAGAETGTVRRAMATTAVRLRVVPGRDSGSRATVVDGPTVVETAVRGGTTAGARGADPQVEVPVTEQHGTTAPTTGRPGRAVDVTTGAATVRGTTDRAASTTARPVSATASHLGAGATAVHRAVVTMTYVADRAGSGGAADRSVQTTNPRDGGTTGARGTGGTRGPSRTVGPKVEDRRPGGTGVTSATIGRTVVAVVAGATSGTGAMPTGVTSATVRGAVGTRTGGTAAAVRPAGAVPGGTGVTSATIGRTVAAMVAGGTGVTSATTRSATGGTVHGGTGTDVRRTAGAGEGPAGGSPQNGGLRRPGGRSAQTGTGSSVRPNRSCPKT